MEGWIIRLILEMHISNKVYIMKNYGLYFSLGFWVVLVGFLISCQPQEPQKESPRWEKNLEKDWRFTREDEATFQNEDFDDTAWEEVRIPHDWAIYGPFDKDNDPQEMAIVQDGQEVPEIHLGRTGALPFEGVGWYRRVLKLPEDIESKKTIIQFDGAMSHAEVYINGKKIGQWPYGYNSFYFDISDAVKPGKNRLAVRLENLPLSSRWYPGAGLYRHVHLIVSEPTRISHWGTTITTEHLEEDKAQVKMKTVLESPEEEGQLKLVTEIKDDQGHVVAEQSSDIRIEDHKEAIQDFEVENPALWSVDNPALYTAVSRLYKDDKLVDEVENTFGIRTIEVVPDKGFFVNGEEVIFKGVNLHHDFGALGAAVSDAAVRRQVRIMKEMGANAIRSSHNMPSPELVRACDEMGMYLMAETFDEWKQPKMKNGYNLIFDDWADRDITNLVAHYKNAPSIVMWSIGNEVPEQGDPEGHKVAEYLQGIFHREDPTRPVTLGMDNPDAVLKYGMAEIMDVAGFNYRPFKYREAHKKLPQKLVLGSETVSTFSSRGVYTFPVERRSMMKYDDFQASSYDVEHASWSQLPEDNFIQYDDLPYVIGEFVWTGFDYLGEPTPYYTEWPSRSSLFGIVDLAGLPKDRYYLYKSFWKPEEETLHILPHWNWEGREGETTPIFVYTNYPSAEVFINGESQGVRKKDTDVDLEETENHEGLYGLKRQRRYRLMWMDTQYEPGTVKVVAFDKDGKEVARDSVVTAKDPHHLEVKVDRKTLSANGKDLAFITVSLRDEDGNFNPVDDREIEIEVSGPGHFKAIDNGDPTSTRSFQEPKMPTFSGKLVAIVEADEEPGEIQVTAKSEGLESTMVKINTEK